MWSDICQDIAILPNVCTISCNVCNILWWISDLHKKRPSAYLDTTEMFKILWYEGYSKSYEYWSATPLSSTFYVMVEIKFGVSVNCVYCLYTVKTLSMPHQQWNCILFSASFILITNLIKYYYVQELWWSINMVKVKLFSPPKLTHTASAMYTRALSQSIFISLIPVDWGFLLTIA